MSGEAEFRRYLYAEDSERLAPVRGMDPVAFGRAARSQPFPKLIIDGYAARASEPFRGITCDGQVEPGLFHLADEGAPTAEMVGAATALLARLTAAERARVGYPVDAVEWRRWSNPEFLVHDNGLRLERCTAETRAAILGLIGASLSAAGLAKARGCMKTNAFLGRICQLQTIMNEWSYNFLLFGEPSPDRPWGWNIYGHHLALNCVVLGRQMVISPTFMGAEPNVIDEGPDAGLRLFDAEEQGGLALMRSLSPALREQATIYRSLEDLAMPEGRWHPADERHLGGAFHDNRVVPLEGVCAGAFTARQRSQLLEIVAAFITYLPDAPLKARLAAIEALLDRTWWSWIGGHGPDDPFYYRVQSPVIMVEFDHHSGVWLNNRHPAKCHIHTIVRTPNGNDYGRDLLRQHYAQCHPGCSPGVE